MNIQVDSTSSNLASAMLNSKIRPRTVVGYGVKIFHPSPPNYVHRSPGLCYKTISSCVSYAYVEKTIPPKADNHLLLRGMFEFSQFSSDPFWLRKLITGFFFFSASAFLITLHNFYQGRSYHIRTYALAHT